MNIQPDLEFISYLRGVGGDTLKKCYQCATCSVVCPLSKDQKPFPRKEMIWSQWGLKENLLADPDVFLCHQCGDCSEKCPRGARPGDVMGAIRAYAYTFYGWPSGLAKLASSAKGLPVMIAIPTVALFVLWLISGAMGFPTHAEFAKFGYQRFFGHWNFEWYEKNIFFIVLLTVPAFLIALISIIKGVSKLWKGMAERSNFNQQFRPSTNKFISRYLWPSIVEILSHTRFNECKANTDRVTGHKPLMWAFIGLFVVTCWSLFANDIMGLFIPSMRGPMYFWSPFKLLANVSAIALLYGIWVLWTNRSKDESEAGVQGSFYDWFLIWEIMAVGVSGLLAEISRWAGLPVIGYCIYFIHLVAVTMLFLYLPYTKLAHMVYRTFAMAFEKAREGAFGSENASK